MPEYLVSFPVEMQAGDKTSVVLLTAFSEDLLTGRQIPTDAAPEAARSLHTCNYNFPNIHLLKFWSQRLKVFQIC